MSLCFQVKPTLRLVFLALLVVLLNNSPVRADEIKEFVSTIKLENDGALDVKEDLIVNFTNANKHGIYRFFPTEYERYGNRYSTDFKLLAVSGDKNVDSESGQSHVHDFNIPYTTSRHGRDFVMKIGSPKKTVSGLHQYHIHYRLRRAVNFFAGAPEIYWNVTGDESTMPIEKAVAHVVLPKIDDMSKVRAQGFLGPEGSTTPAAFVKESGSVTFRASNIAPGEELTVVVGLPAGIISKPTQWQEFLYIAADWWPAVAFPFLTFGASFLLWWYLGRDAINRMPVGVEWDPPKDLTPAEVGTLIDETCDTQDMVSTLVDLAVRGFLHIQEIETKKLLFLRNKDYQFTLLPTPPNAAPLAEFENLFLNGMFKTSYSSRSTVKLSELQNQFSTNFNAIKKSIYKTLVNKGMFMQSPETVRDSWRSVGGLLCFCSFFVVGYQTSYFVGMFISGIILFCFAPGMPARTRKGCENLNQCLAFQRFVRKAEKERIKKLATEDPTIFGRLLPYAMVMGAADQWAEAFKDLVTEAPTWYTPYGPYSNFSTYSFISDLGDSTRTMGQALSSPPPSSSSGGSGGSGFSGGSSGGGFGGGGTSSW